MFGELFRIDFQMKKPLVSVRIVLPVAACRGVFAALLWSIPSLLMAKKVVALLVLPPGLVWLGLMAMVAWPGLHRWGRGLAALLLVGLHRHGQLVVRRLVVRPPGSTLRADCRNGRSHSMPSACWVEVPRQAPMESRSLALRVTV